MREQIYLSLTVNLDEVKVMRKLSSLMKLRIIDCGLRDCKYGLRTAFPKTQMPALTSMSVNVYSLVTAVPSPSRSSHVIVPGGNTTLRSVQRGVIVGSAVEVYTASILVFKASNWKNTSSPEFNDDASLLI
jgi:hypothetical protein